MRLVAIGLLTGLLLAGVLWWQERQLSLAASALEEGKPQYALYLVTRFLEGRPDHVRARALQGRVLVELGHIDRAIEVFDRIGPATVEDLYAFARAYMLREEWSSAVPVLTRVQQLRPDDVDVSYELASCQMRLGMYHDSLRNANRFAEAPGNSARGQVLIGSIHGLMRSDFLAEKAFQRVLQEEPEGKNLQLPAAEFFLRYGRVLLNLGKPREAIQMLKQCVARQQIAEAFVLLGDAASQLGESQNAESAWKMAIQVEPTNQSARISLANAALLARDGNQALRWLEPLRDHKFLSSAECYLFQRTYTLLGDTGQATAWQARTDALRKEESILSAIDNFITSNPESFWSRAARAHHFAAEKNWPQAELLVSKLIEETPGEPFIIELADAIRRRSKLPELTRIPVVRH
jgi:tetratricopeptide (TPR) repeat protein